MPMHQDPLLGSTLLVTYSTGRRYVKVLLRVSWRLCGTWDAAVRSATDSRFCAGVTITYCTSDYWREQIGIVMAPETFRTILVYITVTTVPHMLACRWHHWFWMMAWHRTVAKPLSKPVLAKCYLYFWEHISVKSKSTVWFLHWGGSAFEDVICKMASIWQIAF